MGFFDGLLSPLITQTANDRGAYLGGQEQGQNDQVKQAIQMLTLKRQQDADALKAQLDRAQIGHLNAQAKSLDEGVWGNAFPATDPDDPTKQILVQQHKQNGQLRRATLGDPSAPTPAVASAPPKPAVAGTSNAGIDDSQDMTGGAPGATPSPQSSPPPTVAQDSTPKPTGGLRPVPKVTTTRPQSMIPGTPEWTAAETTKAKIAAQFRAPPVANNVYVTGVDSTGKPTIYTGKSKGDPTLTNTNVGKPAPAGAGGSASLSPEDRAKMKTQAQLDHDTMTAYENKLLADGKTVGMAAGLAGASADAHGGVLNNMIGIVGNKAAGAVDPDYQRYLTAQRSYGRIMGNLQSKRYTDHQAEIERSISGMQGADLAGTIRYKQQLRDASLADPAISPAGGGRGSGAPAPKGSAGNPFADLVPKPPGDE